MPLLQIVRQDPFCCVQSFLTLISHFHSSTVLVRSTFFSLSHILSGFEIHGVIQGIEYCFKKAQIHLLNRNTVQKLEK